MSRLAVAWRALRLEQRARIAERRAAAALERAGASVFGSTAGVPLGGGAPEAARALVRRLTAIDDHEQRARAALDSSMAADRRDLAHVAERARWLVILRGFFERWIARHQLARERAERPEIERELGALALDGAADALRDRVPADAASAVLAARAEVQAARAERAALLAPHGGRALPLWLGTALDELTTLAHFVVEQILKKALLKPPALAGLIAGWAVARLWTPSLLERLDDTVGGFFFEEEHARRRALEFWAPIVAAAVCAYLGALFDRWVQRRYAIEPGTGRRRSAKHHEQAE